MRQEEFKEEFDGDIPESFIFDGLRVQYGKHPQSAAADVRHFKDAQTRMSYEALLDAVSFEPRSILELGYFEGGSLLLWRWLFPEAKVCGVDPTREHIAPKTLAAMERNGIEARCEMPADLCFDLIIDDAGHVFDDVAANLARAWPLLEKGGVYVVEDWHLPAHGPARIVALLSDLVIGSERTEHFCDGPLPEDAAAVMFVFRRLIAVVK